MTSQHILRVLHQIQIKKSCLIFICFFIVLSYVYELGFQVRPNLDYLPLQIFIVNIETIPFLFSIKLIVVVVIVPLVDFSCLSSSVFYKVILIV